MTAEEIAILDQTLTEGLTADQAAVVRAALQRDTVKSKTLAIRQQKDLDDLVARRAALEAELEGGPEKPGARAYQRWYDENFAKVSKLQQDKAKYVEKYGELDAPKDPGTPKTGLSEAEIQVLIERGVEAKIQSQYAPRWADLLKGTGKVVNKHHSRGRKQEIDWDALEKLAPKYNGDLAMAYDEWDRPNVEAADKEDREKEIKRRVDEELSKRGNVTNFPSAADSTPSAMTARSKADKDKFDPIALKNSMALEWATAKSA